MVFFRLVQGVRVQKKASCRGNPQHKASLLTMILFLFFLSVISGPDAQRECHFEDQREWEGTAGSLFILYDRPLVNTICSGSHYIPTAIFVQII